MLCRRFRFYFSLALLLSISSTSLSQASQFQRADSAQITFEFSEVVQLGGDTRELAVAFHAITFIDSIAHPIGEIVFGTPEANALQGEGWFENETWPDIPIIKYYTAVAYEKMGEQAKAGELFEELQNRKQNTLQVALAKHRMKKMAAK
ncbi:MAG: hypothetical protein ACE5I1_31745 [bacterium]